MFMTCSTSYCLVTLKDLWNVYMYVCMCNTLLNAGVGLKFIGTGDGRCFGERDVSRMVLTQPAKDYEQ
jgi:hypothetical protein